MIGSGFRTARNMGLGIAALVGMVLAGPSVSATDAATVTQQTEGAIFERQFIMEQLDKDGEVLGNIVAGIEPPAKLAATTRAIAKGARDSVESFRATLPGGRSKPEVWTQHDDFIQRMESFASKADAMAKAGETGDMAAVTGLMVDAMPCKQCHDLYRAPKKPG